MGMHYIPFLLQILCSAQFRDANEIHIEVNCIMTMQSNFTLIVEVKKDIEIYPQILGNNRNYGIRCLLSSSFEHQQTKCLQMNHFHPEKKSMHHQVLIRSSLNVCFQIIAQF